LHGGGGNPRPSRLGAKEKETAPLERGWLIALIGRPSEEGKEGGEAGRGRICGCGGRPARQRGKKKGKGERERLTGRAQASARAEKKKKRERTRAGAGRGWWAAGLFGPKGEKVRFLFFSFLFQTSF
jgi:hypothetical protein